MPVSTPKAGDLSSVLGTFMPLESITVRESDSLRAALAVIDRPGPALALTVDAQGRYKGLVDAASLEGAITAGHGTDGSVGPAIRPNGALPVTAGAVQVGKAIEQHGFVPLIDGDGRPVEFATAAKGKRIPVAEPSLSGNELKYVTECIETGWISSQGGFVKRFEAEIAKRLGVEHALAVSNGTVALHLALLALGVGPGDEVLVPDLTFAATINTVIQAGATPVIVDVDRKTW